MAVLSKDELIEILLFVMIAIMETRAEKKLKKLLMTGIEIKKQI